MSALLGREAALHARARHLPLAVAGVLVVAALCAGADLGTMLLDRVYLRAIARASIVAMAPLAVAAALSMTLTGADPDLEATCPRLSPRERVVRGVVTVAGACLVLGVAFTLSPGGIAGPAAARNVAGLLGTVLLAVTLLPPLLAWLPGFVYAGFTLMFTTLPPPVSTAWWSFLVQPVRLDASWIIAGVLLVAGVVAYAVRGPRRSTA